MEMILGLKWVLILGWLLVMGYTIINPYQVWKVFQGWKANQTPPIVYFLFIRLLALVGFILGLTFFIK